MKFLSKKSKPQKGYSRKGHSQDGCYKGGAHDYTNTKSWHTDVGSWYTTYHYEYTCTKCGHSFQEKQRAFT